VSISEKEYLRRYANIRELMKKDGLDSLLIVGLGNDFDRGNIRYLTGFGSGGWCVFPLEGRPVLLFPGLLGSPKTSKGVEAFNLVEFRDIAQMAGPTEQVIKELARFNKGNKIGIIGMNCIGVSMYLAVKEIFGDRLINVPEYLKPLREIKSAEEIEKLRQSAAVADKVFRRLREIIRPGLSEFSIYAEAKKVIYENGCEYSFDLLDADGARMNMLFLPTIAKLESGGTLFMEISPAYQGYYAQLPVTLPVDKYLPHIEKMVRAWNQADQAARKILRPGTKVSDLYATLTGVIKENGFVSPLRPGHSLGLDMLDFWSIEETSTGVLKSGMVIAVHPSCMVKMFGDGVGLGYSYIINETGFEKMSQIDLAKELLGNV
jgi:Xaa-Pro aminopeptidase